MTFSLESSSFSKKEQLISFRILSHSPDSKTCFQETSLTGLSISEDTMVSDVDGDLNVFFSSTKDHFLGGVEKLLSVDSCFLTGVFSFSFPFFINQNKGELVQSELDDVFFSDSHNVGEPSTDISPDV